MSIDLLHNPCSLIVPCYIHQNARKSDVRLVPRRRRPTANVKHRHACRGTSFKLKHLLLRCRRYAIPHCTVMLHLSAQRALAGDSQILQGQNKYQGQKISSTLFAGGLQQGFSDRSWIYQSRWETLPLRSRLCIVCELICVSSTKFVFYSECSKRVLNLPIASQVMQQLDADFQCRLLGIKLRLEGDR